MSKVRSDPFINLTVDLGNGTGHQPPYNHPAQPYNYSDMTGFNNHIVNPECPLRGYWMVVEDGGWENTLWTSVSWAASTPSGTAVDVYVRASDDRLALSNHQFVRAVSGAQLPDMRGRYLEVRTSLTQDACEKDIYLERLTICRQSPTLLVSHPPTDASVQEGQEAQFQVVAIGTEPLTYQWFFNGTAIPDANQAVLTLSAVDCLDAGQYTVRVADASGEQVVVGPATLDVYPHVIAIPSLGSALVYPAQIVVAGAPTSVSSVEVVLNGFKHGRPDDVDILLVPPYPTPAVILMSDAGGETPVQGLNIIFSQSGSALPDHTQLSTQIYLPANYGGPGEPPETSFPAANPNPPTGPYSTDLSILNGTNPNGTWRLYVVDDSAQQSGWISGSWCLILQP